MWGLRDGDEEITVKHKSTIILCGALIRERLGLFISEVLEPFYCCIPVIALFHPFMPLHFSNLHGRFFEYLVADDAFRPVGIIWVLNKSMCKEGIGVLAHSDSRLTDDHHRCAALASLRLVP